MANMYLQQIKQKKGLSEEEQKESKFSNGTMV